MTKTLTENKWFYTENGIKDASWNIVFKREVLAPVPSYDEYKQLVSKTDKLEKKLEIATKALKEINVRSQRDWNEYDCMGCARKALYDIEMEGVK